MANLVPKYTVWEAINAAVLVGARALEEIRALARTPGPRGADGLGFDDLAVEHDGARNFKFVMTKGEQRKEFAFSVPMMIYRGIYRDGQSYEHGDVATWGGSLWHCNEPTNEKPGDGSKAWSLAAKRGRDGRDGAPAPKPIAVR